MIRCQVPVHQFVTQFLSFTEILTGHINLVAFLLVSTVARQAELCVIILPELSNIGSFTLSVL